MLVTCDGHKGSPVSFEMAFISRTVYSETKSAALPLPIICSHLKYLDLQSIFPPFPVQFSLIILVNDKSIQLLSCFLTPSQPVPICHQIWTALPCKLVWIQLSLSSSAILIAKSRHYISKFPFLIVIANLYPCICSHLTKTLQRHPIWEWKLKSVMCCPHYNCATHLSSYTNIAAFQGICTYFLHLESLYTNTSHFLQSLLKHHFKVSEFPLKRLIPLI